MKNFTTFYANLVWAETDNWQSSKGLPEGAYQYSRDREKWYLRYMESWLPINDPEDVPKALRFWLLIL